MITTNKTQKTSSPSLDYTVIDSSQAVCILSSIFFNTNPSTPGTIKMRILDGSLVEKSKILESEVLPKDTVIVDSKIFLAPDDKVIVNSSISGIDCTFSITEG